jgi:hypothetical protein
VKGYIGEVPLGYTHLMRATLVAKLY